MKVLRYSFVAAVAIFAAACGDKVNIVQPSTTTTSAVTAVAVAPTAATMSIGQTVSFTAAVTATGTAATTVTWSSSDGSKVSVSATGVATAVAATPGVAICATSTVNVNAKGCASVVVSAVPTTTPISSSISISSITTGGNLNTPVNPLNTAGQIDVRVNVVQGSTKLDSIVLFVGGKRADGQQFSAAQSAALRYASDKAIETQTVLPQILFNVNTAAFTTTAATGLNTVTFPNGSQQISVRLFAGGATAAAATAQTSLTFNNIDTYVATITPSGTTANALAASGFRYDRGGLTVAVGPVSYTGGVVQAGTVSFGSAVCDASGIGARTVPLVGPVAPDTRWTATILQTGTAGAGNVNGYEFNGGIGGCTLNPIGESIAVTATNANGDALFAAAAPANANVVFGTVAAAVSLRLDNRGPLNPAGSTNAGTGIVKLNLNPNGRANNWLNDAVTFNGTAKTTATSDNFLCVGATIGVCTLLDTLPRDAGVGGPTYFVRVGTTKTLASTAAAKSTSPVAPVRLDSTATNLTFCAIAYGADALGNETASPDVTTACGAEVNNVNIGIDRAPPTIAYTAGNIAANARIGTATIALNFQVTVNDTGLVGNSGMLPTAPVLMTLTRRAAGATPNSAGTTTLLAADGATVVTALSATGVVAGAPLYTTAIAAITGVPNYAYWTHNARAKDAAGNTASVSPRTMVFDATAAVPGTPSTALTLAATGYAATAFINEDLDIQDYAFGVTYPTPGGAVLVPGVLQQPVVAVNGFNAAIFSNTTFPVTTTVNLPLAIQANNAAGLRNMVSVATTARSQSNLSATSAPFTPTTITPGAVIANGAPFTGFPAVALPAGVTGVVTGNTTAATAATPATAVLTATISGTTAIFNNPFARMDFYMLNAAGTQYFFVGSATAATLNDNGAVRTFTFTTTINGATVYSLLGGGITVNFTSQIVGLGMNASGTIGMEPAALTAINVVF